MDVEESAPAAQAPSFTELRLEAQGAVPGMRLPPREEKKVEEAPKEVPSPKVEEPEAPKEAPEEPEEESTLVLRKQPALPSSHKAMQRRSFSARARDYLQGRRIEGEPRPKLLERPEVLLTYAQVIFNASILVVFLYLLFCMVYTIQRDVSQKVHEYEIGTWSLLRRISRRDCGLQCSLPSEPLRDRPAGPGADRGVRDVAAVCGARPDRRGARACHGRDLCRDPEWIRGRSELEDDGRSLFLRSSFRCLPCRLSSERPTRRCPSSAARRPRASRRTRQTTPRRTMHNMRCRRTGRADHMLPVCGRGAQTMNDTLTNDRSSTSWPPHNWSPSTRSVRRRCKSTSTSCKPVRCTSAHRIEHRALNAMYFCGVSGVSRTGRRRKSCRLIRT